MLKLKATYTPRAHKEQGGYTYGKPEDVVIVGFHGDEAIFIKKNGDIRVMPLPYFKISSEIFNG